ncbi:MAG: RNA polymerase sigma factor [Bacteroidota bacterium]
MLSERQIIEGCQARKKSSQKELVLRYSAMLMAACRRYVKDEATAKDVLQETFIRIFTHIDKYQPIGPFENWMRRIAVRCALTWLDKSKFKKETELTVQHLNGAVEPDVYHYLGFEEINKLIDELPLGYRTVFNLRVVEGYSHKEIAELLEIQESASRSQLARAKRMLRKRINLFNAQKRASI